MRALLFDWNDECVFFNISKPSTSDLDTYEVYELNSPLPPSPITRRLPDPTRNDKYKSIPMGGLRKGFGHTPEKVIKKSLDNTTQYYLDIPEEIRENSQNYFRNRFPSLPTRR